MDLSFTPEQEAFRAELRAWLDEHLPWPEGPPSFATLSDEVDALRQWQRQLAEAGWVGVAWPAEYGGRGTGPAEHYIVQEELARARAPELVGRIGVNLAGPTLLAHGTDAQKAQWLPKILRADEIWCQLFSEPGAGSDLAAVATRAEPVTASGAGGAGEGGWKVSGQKVWTSYAQFADWGLCLARTDPATASGAGQAGARKHHGISYLVVDMHAPGVEVRPLVQITGEAEFNEVFLDEVFVPRAQLVGAEHAGWRVARSTLSHERGTSPRQLVIHIQLLSDLAALAVDNGAFARPRVRQRIAEAYTDVRIFQLHNWRTLTRLERGQDPGPEGSMLKLYWSELSQRLHDTAMEVLGPDAALWGRWQRSLLYYRSARIFAGTNEIQRNIIGERVLGLPREPKTRERAR